MQHGVTAINSSTRNEAGGFLSLHGTLTGNMKREQKHGADISSAMENGVRH